MTEIANYFELFDENEYFMNLGTFVREEALRRRTMYVARFLLRPDLSVRMPAQIRDIDTDSRTSMVSFELLHRHDLVPVSRIVTARIHGGIMDGVDSVSIFPAQPTNGYFSAFPQVADDPFAQLTRSLLAGAHA